MLYSDGSGSIDREEFLQIPQIAGNPLASRMIAIFDEECVLAYLIRILYFLWMY
jgi:Ca2+-binding EF-hand superfamily protein